MSTEVTNRSSAFRGPARYLAAIGIIALGTVTAVATDDDGPNPCIQSVIATPPTVPQASAFRVTATVVDRAANNRPIAGVALTFDITDGRAAIAGSNPQQGNTSSNGTSFANYTNQNTGEPRTGQITVSGPPACSAGSNVVTVNLLA